MLKFNEFLPYALGYFYNSELSVECLTVSQQEELCWLYNDYLEDEL